MFIGRIDQLFSSSDGVDFSYFCKFDELKGRFGSSGQERFSPISRILAISRPIVMPTTFRAVTKQRSSKKLINFDRWLDRWRCFSSGTESSANSFLNYYHKMARSVKTYMGMDVTSAQCVNYNPNRGRTLILYRAWTFFTIISALLLCSTFGAILSAYSYEIIIQQYTFTFVILSVSLVVATAVLILGCIEYHDPWTNGIFEKNKFGTEASYYDYEKFRDGYNIMRKARVGIFVEIIFSVFLYWLPQCITRIPSYAKYSVIYDSIFALCVLSNIERFCTCTMLFPNFMDWNKSATPSIGIALANVILYFAVVLDLVCSGLNQIILHPFLDITGDSLREGINNIFNSIPDGVKTGVIVATGVALLKDFISQMFANLTITPG